MVAFLASPKAVAINGDVIAGGRGSAWRDLLLIAGRLTRAEAPRVAYQFDGGATAASGWLLRLSASATKPGPSSPR